MAKVGMIDDSVWAEEPPPMARRASGGRTKHRRWLLVGVPVVILAVGGWWLFESHQGTGSGDPGGKIMNQLTPAATAIPGYGTAAVPSVSQLPPSLDASFIIKIEPRQDSCDGISGTQGWSQVVVQSRFRWAQGLPALTAYMEHRLETLGWTAQPQPPVSLPPAQSWTKTLKNGTRADLSVTREDGAGSSVWQFDAIAEPVGKSAGC
ncbi:MAG: hypothetical protein ABSB68_16980 [Acidimicrobiales bacterium]|jgi:hypothetical protein